MTEFNDLSSLPRYLASRRSGRPRDMIAPGPDAAQMREIVDVHHPQVEKALLEQVLVKFYWLREQKELRKRPSTSELIDWITALLRAGVNPAQLEAELPFMGALLKNEQDTKVISQYLDRDGKLPTSLDELKGPGRR